MTRVDRHYHIVLSDMILGIILDGGKEGKFNLNLKNVPEDDMEAQMWKYISLIFCGYGYPKTCFIVGLPDGIIKNMKIIRLTVLMPVETGNQNK